MALHTMADIERDVQRSYDNQTDARHESSDTDSVAEIVEQVMRSPALLGEVAMTDAELALVSAAIADGDDAEVGRVFRSAAHRHTLELLELREFTVFRESEYDRAMNLHGRYVA